MDDSLANKVMTCSCKATNMFEMGSILKETAAFEPIFVSNVNKNLERSFSMSLYCISVALSFHILQRSASKLKQQLAPKNLFVIFIFIFPATKMAAGPEPEGFTESEASAALAPQED